MTAAPKSGDPLRRFVLPNVYSNAPGGAATASCRNKPLQVPPMDRGELKAFQSNARGTSNVLVPVKVNDTEAPTGKETSLDVVWRKSLFNQAPQIAEIDAAVLNKVSDGGTTKILRYLPDRFERGRVQAPQMVVEEVDAALLRDDGAHLMHPQRRREAHEAAVNARQGELALREGNRARSKMIQTCRMNFPHGALGVAESPYTNAGAVYANAEELRRQNHATVRKGRGGHAPPDTMGRALNGDDEPPLKQRGGRKAGAFRPRDSLNFSDMYKPTKTRLADIL